MSAKYSKKEINQIIELTPEELKGKQYIEFPSRLKVGFFHSSGANWSYEVFVIPHNNSLIEVVGVFGSIL